MAKVRANTTTTNDPVINSGAGQDTLQTGFGKFNAHFHEYPSAHLLNVVGSQVVAGDVVALSRLTSQRAFDLDDTQASLQKFGVVQETINNLASGEVATCGVVRNVKCTGTIASTNYVRKSATTKAIERFGSTVTVGSTNHAPEGAIGFAISAAVGGLVDIFLFDMTVMFSRAVANSITMASGTVITPAAVSGTPAQHGLFRENILKGWVYCGVAQDIHDSFNVATITDVGTGQLTVVWDRDFTNTNYAALVTIEQSTAAERHAYVDTGVGAKAVGSVSFRCTSGTPANVDPENWNVIAAGDQ